MYKTYKEIDLKKLRRKIQDYSSIGQFAYMNGISYESFIKELWWQRPITTRLPKIIAMLNEGYIKGNFTTKPIKKLVIEDFYKKTS